MKQFTFHPELFEIRAKAMETLSSHGVHWFLDYQSVDLMHDLYGIEITGIRTEATGRRICKLLWSSLRDMPHHRCFYNDSSSERSWQVDFSKLPHESA